MIHFVPEARRRYAGLRRAGIHDVPALNDIEDRTDRLALPAYAALGDADCERLAELARPFGRTIVEAGFLKLG